jgi:hypothetical protein
MQEKPMRGDSAKQVTIDVLRTAGGPLHTKEIAKRVIESGRCAAEGQDAGRDDRGDPRRRVEAGRAVQAVDKATYTLADVDAGEKQDAQRRKRQRFASAKKQQPANASA